MAGIYLHIPFCKQACTYCDFHFSTLVEKNRNGMIKSIAQELEERVYYLHGKPVESVYFGGGTPSILNSEELKLLLKTIKKHYLLSENLELTLEANPDDITPEKLKLWKEMGINRLSIGVQSFRQEDLDWMNRAHNLEEAKASLKLSNDFGFKLSVDLIYGLPNMSLTDLEANIVELFKYNPEHISAYCLTIEEKTVLHHKVLKGEIKASTNEEQSVQFDFLVEKLKSEGYEQYEISNFARDEFYAVHNSNYWMGKRYLGVGPSAHSYNGKSRSWNIANNTRYIKSIAEGSSCSEEEELSEFDKFNEALLVGLRTKWGVIKNNLNPTLVRTESFTSLIEVLKKDKLLIESEDAFILTQEGKLKADGIASELFILEDEQF